MSQSSVSGHGAGSTRYDVGGGHYLRGAAGSGGIKDDLTSDKEAVTSLLRQLDDAEKTSKSQTARDLRDNLHGIREEFGEERFKQILELMKKELFGRLLALLEELFSDLFQNTPSPTSAPLPGRGGGGGAGVRRDGFGPTESMSNKQPASAGQYHEYEIDNSDPGKKPGKEKNQPGNIWSGFSQGVDGNCVTVSSIKAAMMQYGQKPTDVFQEVEKNGDGFNVTMRDGFKLYLSQNEFKSAAAHAQFNGDDKAMMTSANFMYAASAKRAQIEGNDGKKGLSFQEALDSLKDGEDSREGLDRLGLRGRYRAATDEDLRNSAVGTVEYNGHSMAVIDGKVELWGQRGGVPQSGMATVLF